MQTLLSCREIVGLNLAVVRGNDTLLTKGYGSASLAQSKAVNERTLFSIASLSKAFASTLLGIVLAESDK